MNDRKARICVPVCVGRLADLDAAVKRAAEVADYIELRLDCLAAGELSEAVRNWERLRTVAARPFILTFRPPQQGGKRVFDLRERIDFWSQQGTYWDKHQRQPGDLADIEAELIVDRSPSSEFWLAQLTEQKAICSHHDFNGVPENLEEIYARMAATNARVLKIAVQAHDSIDCIPILKLLARANHEGREMIAIAMGQAGVMTRILGPSLGSFLTYASLDGDSTTAPGQFTARELRETYRIDTIDQQTEVMGVIGRPVTHSISPQIHNAALAKAKFNAVFIPFEVHDLDSFLRRMVKGSSREIEWNLRGLAVTAPHKSAVMKHLDWIAPAAKAIGAVNTIVAGDAALRGYNTDAVGFIEPLKRRLRSLEGMRCGVVGAGGAARAVVWALRNEQAAVTLFARDPDRANLAEDFEIECRSLAGATFNEFDVIVNCTPLGTRGEFETETPVTSDQMRGVRLAYDLVYNPLETRFIREARYAGCETIGGLEMLLGQAVEQFRLWTGLQPSEEMMKQTAIAVLAA